MTKQIWFAAVVAAVVGVVGGCGGKGERVGKAGSGGVPGASAVALPEAPAAPREFRAAWVATVANIDWPTKPGLSTEEQQKEAIAILDRLQELNMNAAILQVRTSADALYESSLEPWSYYLTGVQGKAPEPYYDPLKFWVDEAHKRGIELHAWFNPFRAKQGGAKYDFAANHVASTNPDWAPKYGPYYWMNPAVPEARQRSLDVFLDVVKRYDVDGIHIDDYFYPYPVVDPNDPEKKRELQFPDEELYAKYQAGGGTLSRDDWRRDAINVMIRDIYVGAKKIKPWVKFGISPFGLPYGETMPEGIKGFNQHDKLYADVILWLNNGWLDYWTPQLYWPSEQRPQSYPILLDYWTTHNPWNRHIWPGLFTSRVRDGEGGRAWPALEVVNQIRLTRWRPRASGHVHFSMKALMGDRGGLAPQLKEKLYGEPALVPASPWLGKSAVRMPRVDLSANGSSLTAAWDDQPAAWQYGVWVRYGETWRFRVLPGSERSVTLTDDMAMGGPVTEVVVSAVDRNGNESVRNKMARPVTMKYPWPGLTTRPTQ